MFFGPSILELVSKNKVYVLCLSIGNESGLGEIRKKELEASCISFGINIENVTCLDHPLLQDGPTNVWDVELISEILDYHVNKNDVDMQETP
ncbi:11117_t:CDS:2 [Diversispora eburnea]|uniref:N-acetylglucosaminylphosphatidylinositol deacetylase n=1 Tax=Diversispora eburnea TaxID=1213867 RepID=A0A9N9AWH9_9GLOM|nr:11117_t:CDS:2 [Diversispora eburnea]